MSLIFTGDMTVSDPLWVAINKIQNLRYLIIESAFSEQKKDVAIRSKYLCPSLLAEELEKLTQDVEIYITYFKQGEADLTMCDIQACAGKFNPRRLTSSQVFEFQ